MFKDTEKELKRLEEQLLQEEKPLPEDTDELLRQLHQELDEEPISAYNTDRADRDLSQLVQEEAAPKEKLTGLVISALLLTAGILGLLAWWLMRLFA